MANGFCIRILTELGSVNFQLKISGGFGLCNMRNFVDSSWSNSDSGFCKSRSYGFARCCVPMLLDAEKLRIEFGLANVMQHIIMEGKGRERNVR